MTQDQFKERWDELKHPLKSRWTKLTDEDVSMIAGDLEKFNGMIQKRYGEMKEGVSAWVEVWYAGVEDLRKTSPA
jgi:uncharacterized protein YjbJ (UPF0337 family)